VLYSYRAGLATVVWAPLRVCIIELQAGEKIVGEPQIGDSVRSGRGRHLRPRSEAPNCRAGHQSARHNGPAGVRCSLSLIPKTTLPAWRFLYPEDDSIRRWQRHLADQQAHNKQKSRTAEVLPAMTAVENGGAQSLRPLRVYDDGAKTFIQMRRELQHVEAPVLLVLGPDGKGQMTNYRVREQTYIIDRLFDRAQLVLGTGKKAQKVEIRREPRG
jgi:type IV secretory pathway VirB9-like protein